MPIISASNILEFKPVLSADYNGPVLPGSRQFSCETEAFNLTIQEFRSELYTIRYNLFQFLKHTTLDSHSALAGLHTRVLLKNKLQHKIKDLGKLEIGEEQCGVLWAEHAICETRFIKNEEYKTLDIFYSPSLAEQLAFFFPQLSDIMIPDRITLLSKHPIFITPSMQDIIRQILECPYDDHTSRFYFDIKVREFLYILLQNIYKKPPLRYKLSDEETALVVNARQRLLEDLGRKAVTVTELSKIVGLNTFKLKAGFQQLFGVGIFECLQEKRMEKARELLLTTNKPIKDICTLTGYPRMTNFITAFRKKFGYTPGSLRRNA